MHHKLGIHKAHLYEFCDILLASIVQSTGRDVSQELIRAWRNVFKYVVAFMALEKISVSPSSDRCMDHKLLREDSEPRTVSPTTVTEISPTLHRLPAWAEVSENSEEAEDVLTV
jgi:hypothetical protein